MESSRTLRNLFGAACLFAPLYAHAIIGGVAPDSPASRVDPNTATSPFAGIGSITIGGGTFTGTLIDRSDVLTAAHVVNGQAASAVTFNLNAGGNLTYQGQASTITIDPAYQGFTPGADGIVHNDLAIIHLSTPVPDSVPVYAIDTTALSLGTTLTFVGYGMGGSGDVGATVGADPAVKRVGENRVEMLTPIAAGQTQSGAYLFRFDSPTDGYSLGNTVEATLGSGDSGSPALVQDASGQWKIAAVNTFVASFTGSTTAKGVFGTGGGGMLLAEPTTANWIAATVAPVPEPSTGGLMLGGVALVGMIGAGRKLGRRHSTPI